MKTFYLLCVTVSLLVATSAHAADDAKIRDTLRTLTLRLRSAETEKNALLSDKAQLEAENKTLKAKSDDLAKQTAADKEQLDSLTAKTADQDKQLGETKESLDKWKTAYDQVATAAKKAQAERATARADAIELRRKLDDRERKNVELYRIAREILTRYEKFGLGDALAAREPFTGITRVKLENLVQDYSDKIADQQVRDPATKTTTTTTTTSTTRDESK